MRQPNDELVGVGEIADMAEVSTPAVANWRVRYADFPHSITELACGPIFRRSQIRSWLKTHKKNTSMAHVISTINLKDGVAKTSLSVALADVFSAEMGKKVLVIDLDPQIKTTITLLGETKWLELNKAGHTLSQLFKDAITPDLKKFNLKNTLQKRVGDVQDAGTIDLLPSSLDLIGVQDQLASATSEKFYSINPTEILWRAIKSKLDDYDIVIVNCPPSLGLITLNGLRMSDAYIVPTVPDHLSTYGIPQIVTRVGDFAGAIGEKIEPLGIIITKYQASSTVHNTVMKQLRTDPLGLKVYKTNVPQTRKYFTAADAVSGKRTLRQKYGAGSTGLAATYIDLAKEIWSDLEDKL